MSDQQKLLWIGDSPNSNSGYGRVIRELGDHLNKNFKLSVFGLNNHASPYQEREYNVVDTLDNSGPMGYNKIRMILATLQPDIIIILNDVSIIASYITNLKDIFETEWGKKIVKIGYVCVDYENILVPQAKILNDNLDGVFTMTQFGKKECQKAQITKPIHVLPHGFNGDTFVKVDKKVARRHLNEMAGKDGIKLEDEFIIFCGNKNQIRKRLDITIHAYVYFLHKYWDQTKKQPILLLNCGMVDAGWNLIEMFRNFYRQYNLPIDMESEYKFLRTTTTELEHPNYPDQFLNVLYNAADIGINTSMGESWGLVTFEQGGIERPQIITNFGALDEIYKKGVYKVETSDYFVHPLSVQSTMGQGRVVNYKDVAEAINYYYTMSEDDIKKHGSDIAKTVSNYKWPLINIKMKKAIEKIQDDKLIYEDEITDDLNELNKMDIEIKEINEIANQNEIKHQKMMKEMEQKRQLDRGTIKQKLDNLGLGLEFEDDREVIMS